MTMFSSRNWREYPSRYRLEATRFTKSGKTYYPKRLVDPETGDTEQETVVLPFEGTVLTYTIIRIAPSQWGDLARTLSRSSNSPTVHASWRSSPTATSMK